MSTSVESPVPAEGTPAPAEARQRGWSAALQRWRQAGKVPRHLRLGGRVLYPIADVLAFEAGRVSARRDRVQP